VDGVAEAHAGTIPSFVRTLGAQFGERDAVVLDGDRLTYRGLEESSRLLARGLLHRGLAKGARVGVWLRNGPQWVVTWAAVTRAGGVAVPLSTLARGAELRRTIAHADLIGIVTERRHLRHDRFAQLEAALPGLAEAGDPVVVPGAPYLRWVACIDAGDLPAWAHDLSWLTEPGPVTDDVLDRAEAEVVPSDPAIMIYTSGTTSDPKGVVHSHENVVTKARYLCRQQGFEDGERSFTQLPFFWVGGLSVSLLPVLAAGGTQVCLDEFDAGAVLEVLERERVSRANFLPDKLAALRAHPDFASRDLSALRVGNAELLAAPGPEVGQTYHGLSMGLGMTESLGCYWWGRFDDGRASIRAPNGARRTPPLHELQPGVELRVADADGRPVGDGESGEIQVRGACIATSLHKQSRAESFTPDGYLRTGDCGEVLGGTVFFRGRLKEIIKTAGANVAPAEVVAALLDVDGIAAAHVVGIADAERGEVVAALVVAEDAVEICPATVKAQLREQMSPFKVPKHVVVVARDELPWNDETDKVRTADLVALIERRVHDEA
jgi:acyl-CoA synthetase (AMP-forming)/AMP-acid ligase II